MRIKLTHQELQVLIGHPTSIARKGGFQNFLVQLGFRVDETSGELELDEEDIRRINNYATRYGRGGYQSRVFRIFGRSLGPMLEWPEKRYKKFML